MKNIELQHYLQTQITQTTKRVASFTHDRDGNPLFTRTVFSVLQQYAADFLQGKSDPRVIAMPGLRGAGKTTLLSQLFATFTDPNITKLYLSVDEAIRRFNVNLWDILENYEELLGKHLEEFSTPLIFFLDEIHYDKQWSIFLKTIYDKTKNAMVFCTGSSALLLREQINADVARRVLFVDINPVCFSEYMLFKHKKQPAADLGVRIKDALFSSKNAQDVFEKLKKEKAKIKHYWLDVDNLESQRYIKLGTIPFTLQTQNPEISLNFIAQIINKVIYTDIPQFYPFTTETLNRIDRVLYLISNTLGVNVAKLSETLGMKPDTLHLILRALESSGLLLRILPHGASFKQVKKPSKYLFATPALRFSYLSSRDSTGVFEIYQGSLLEDLVGMYLNMILPKFGGCSLTYDAAEGGTDFIVTIGNQKISLEVSSGKKDYKQIIKTSQKIEPNYSLIISNNDFEYKKEHNAVKVPWEFFLLL